MVRGKRPYERRVTPTSTTSQGCLFGNDERERRGAAFLHVVTESGMAAVEETEQRFVTVDDLVADVVNKDTTHPAKWERVMRVPMRFNRLVLFSPWQFHTAAPGFGTDPESARLVMLLFFARAGR